MRSIIAKQIIDAYNKRKKDKTLKYLGRDLRDIRLEHRLQYKEFINIVFGMEYVSAYTSYRYLEECQVKNKSMFLDFIEKMVCENQ